jgi:4-amino-4-deoxychorismate lyase
MCLLTEAIKVENKKLNNLEYHQARVDKARRELLGLPDKIVLSEVISIPENIDESIYKCRIVYSNSIHLVEFTRYDKRLPKTMKLVYKDEIDYSFKYENRRQFKLLLDASAADEIVIVKNGLITDTSRSNIVLSNGEKFVTPKSYLLEGTKRKELLEKEIITEEEISIDGLNSYHKLFLINAMLDLNNQPGFPVKEIIR